MKHLSKRQRRRLYREALGDWKVSFNENVPNAYREGNNWTVNGFCYYFKKQYRIYIDNDIKFERYFPELYEVRQIKDPMDMYHYRALGHTYMGRRFRRIALKKAIRLTYPRIIRWMIKE